MRQVYCSPHYLISSKRYKYIWVTKLKGIHLLSITYGGQCTTLENIKNISFCLLVIHQSSLTNPVKWSLWNKDQRPSRTGRTRTRTKSDPGSQRSSGPRGPWSEEGSGGAEEHMERTHRSVTENLLRRI